MWLRDLGCSVKDVGAGLEFVLRDDDNTGDSENKAP